MAILQASAEEGNHRAQSEKMQVLEEGPKLNVLEAVQKQTKEVPEDAGF